jgi:hypothetical protein
VPLPAQLPTAEGVPSDRIQATDCVCVPLLVLAEQVPVRVCGRPVPQPVEGVQLVYAHVPVPPVQDPKPLCVQLKLQPLMSWTV